MENNYLNYGNTNIPLNQGERKSIMHICKNISVPQVNVVTALFMVLFALTASAPALADPTITILHTLAGSEGYAPLATLTKASDGTFYGTTFGGSTNGFGTIFNVSGSGSFNTVHVFTGSDGSGSHSALTLDSTGDLYGVAYRGGATYVPNQSIGDGDIFEYGSDGSFSVLYNFMDGSTGRGPATPVKISKGLLYGTAFGGTSGIGVVYAVDAGGNETILHNFVPSEGGGPRGPVVITGGYLYGSMQASSPATGVIYKLSLTAPYRLTILHTLVQAEGSQLLGGLTLGANNLLYGSASQGGASNNGSIFSISKSGDFQLLHSFNGSTDGGDAFSPLLAARDGNLYGVAVTGGANGFGTIYKVTLSGQFSVVTSSTKQNNVFGDAAGLAQGNDGNFYGVFSGGQGDNGDVYRVNVAPTVTSLSPNNGPVGTQVTLKGNNLSAATSVYFGTTAATTFTVVSDTQITALVPSGALTGKVTVTDALAVGRIGRTFTVTQ